MTNELKRVSDVIGSGDIEFHADLQRVDLADIVGEDWVFCDVEILRDWDTEYGKSDWCLLHLKKPDIPEDPGFTTKCGGKVFVKRVAELKARGSFPIIGKIVMKGDSDRLYYQII